MVHSDCSLDNAGVFIVLGVAAAVAPDAVIA
jgi:hypothetical protein